MKILEVNPVISKVLITKEQYEILKDFFADEVSEQLAEEYNYENRLESKYYSKDDYLQEGASLWIVIDEEKEIVYEIIAKKVSFEGFVNTCFYNYDGLGYNDNLIGAYNYVGEYGYILSIENWVEDDDKTTYRMEKVFDLIESRMKNIQHEGVQILHNAINIFREELNRELKMSIIECPVEEYMGTNPKISNYYSIELNNNIYELIRDILKSRVEQKKLDSWFSATYSGNEIVLRSVNNKNIILYLCKRNQKYTLDLCKYKEYEKGKYHNKEYNEFVLPEKEVLIEIFELLKESNYKGKGVETYDFVPNLLINTVNNFIK